MTCASRQRRRSGAPSRTQASTAASTAYAPYLRSPGARTHGYLHAASSDGAGEVQPAARDLELEPGEDAQRLRVALEAAAGARELVEGAFAVVPERGVADVVGEPRGVDDVGVAAQVLGHPPPDLGHLEGVREPGARHAADLGAFARPDDLRLAREPPQRRGVQHAGAVAGERAAALPPPGMLGGFGHAARPVVIGVSHPRPEVSVSTDAWVRR